MSAPDLRAELEREDALRREGGLPPGARARIRSRLEATIGRRGGGARWRRPVLWLAAASVAAIALVVWSRSGGPTVAGFAIEQRSSDFAVIARNDGIRIERGQATVTADDVGITFQNDGPMTFRRESEGVRVVRGHAEFSVRHRPGDARPAEVLVSGGAIQIMGTRFTVEQEESGGSVTLHEGAIRFQPASGEPVILRPGESLRWPLPAVVAPETPAPATSPSPPAALAPRPHTKANHSGETVAAPAISPPAPPALEDVLHELEVLRSRGEFEQAAQHLEAALRNPPVGSREILSFELGSLLTYQLHDRTRACAQWARHERAFHGGRYAPEISRAREALGCSESDDGAKP